MDKHPIQIIQLSPDQWKDYQKIRLEALSSDPEAFGETYDNVIKHDEQVWRNKLANPDIVWVFAKEGEKLVGMVGAYLKPRDLPPEYALIVGMYTNKNARGKGVGKLMLHTLLEKIKEKRINKKVQLEIYQTQEVALTLYKSSGFEITKTRKGIRGDNGFESCGDFVMEKTL